MLVGLLFIFVCCAVFNCAVMEVEESKLRAYSLTSQRSPPYVV